MVGFFKITVPDEDRRDLEEMYNPTTLGDLKTDYDFVRIAIFFARKLHILYLVSIV